MSQSYWYMDDNLCSTHQSLHEVLSWSIVLFFTSYYFCQLYVIGDKCQYMSEKTLFVFGYFHSLCEPILLRVQPCSQAPPPLLQRPCQLEGVGDGG
jgi:hypothetical protein